MTGVAGGPANKHNFINPRAPGGQQGSQPVGHHVSGRGRGGGAGAGEEEVWGYSRVLSQ